MYLRGITQMRLKTYVVVARDVKFHSCLSSHITPPTGLSGDLESQSL